MSHVKLPDIPFDQLALEPLEGEAAPGPITGRAKFTPTPATAATAARARSGATRSASRPTAARPPTAGRHG